jgi:hypothetical protein
LIDLAENTLQGTLQLFGGTRICALQRGGLIANHFRLATFQAYFHQTALVGIAIFGTVAIA